VERSLPPPLRGSPRGVHPRIISPIRRRGRGPARRSFHNHAGVAFDASFSLFFLLILSFFLLFFTFFLLFYFLLVDVGFSVRSRSARDRRPWPRTPERNSIPTHVIRPSRAFAQCLSHTPREKIAEGAPAIAVLIHSHHDRVARVSSIWPEELARAPGSQRRGFPHAPNRTGAVGDLLMGTSGANAIRRRDLGEFC